MTEIIDKIFGVI